MLAAIDAAMGTGSPDGVLVVAPDPVAVDQCTLPRAVGKVFNGGNRNNGFNNHSRFDP